MLGLKPTCMAKLIVAKIYGKTDSYKVENILLKQEVNLPILFGII